MKIIKLKKNFLFKNVYRNGTYTADSYLVVYRITNAAGVTRFGIAAGKKVGGSVIRHRVTRLIREAIRRNLIYTPPGFDVVVLARAGSGDARFTDIEKSYIRLMKRSRLFTEALTVENNHTRPDKDV